MGLLSDLADIAKEFQDIGNEIKGEFDGLKKDVTDSVVDIKTGVEETKQGVKSKVKKSVSMDGMVSAGKKVISQPPRK